MGLNPQTIGAKMPHGYAGGYARQPDMIVNTHPAGAEITFGQALQYDANKNVIPFSASGTAADFVGVASKEIKSAVSYLDQGVGKYAAKEAVPVFMRGAVNVICQKGTPALGGAVYLRIAANTSYPNAAVGGFEAEEDKADSTVRTVKLTNCQWAGPADANKVAEMRILTQLNA